MNKEYEKTSISIPELTSKQAAQIPWHRDFCETIASGISQRLVVNAIVHGSFGDLTFTPYSDLDVTLVIQSKCTESQQYSAQLRDWVLKRLFPFMLRVDPLQHHGPFLLWDNLQSSYSQDILPVNVYRRSWAYQQVALDFHTLPSNPVAPLHLSVATCEALADAPRRFFRRGYNMYSMKRYLSNLMLVPAFYSTDIGNPQPKALSFEPFYETFGEDSAAIRLASALREVWPATPGWLRSTCNVLARFNRYTMPPRFIRLAYRDRSVRSQLLNEIIPEVPRLAKAVSHALGSD